MTAYMVNVAELQQAESDYLDSEGMQTDLPPGYDSFEVVDTAAKIEQLNAYNNETQSTYFAFALVSGYQATDGSVQLSVLAAQNIEYAHNINGVVTVVVPAGDAVTVSGTAAEIATLTASQFAELPEIGVTRVIVTTNADPVSVAYYLANLIGQTNVPPYPYGVYTIADIAANIEALTPSQLAAMQAAGVYGVTATDGSLVFNLQQAVALGLQQISVPTGDTVTIADCAANIENLSGSQIPLLSGYNVTATDTSLTFSVLAAEEFAQYGITLSVPPGNTIGIVDSSSDIEQYLAPAEIALLSFVSSITATYGSLVLTAAQAQALETAGIPVAVAPGDTITVSDTLNNLLALTSDGYSLGAIGITALAVVDIASHIEEATQAEIDQLGTGVSFTATDASVSLNANQAALFAEQGDTIAAPEGDSVTVSDTAGDIDNLSPNGILGDGVDYQSTAGSLVLTVAQAVAFVNLKDTITVPKDDTIGIVDSPVAITSLTPTQINEISSLGVSSIAILGALEQISVNDYATEPLGPPPPPYVGYAISDNAANIEDLSPAAILGLHAAGVYAIAATDTSLVFTAAQAIAFEEDPVFIGVPQGDSIRIVDSAANLEALTLTQLAGLGTLGFSTIAASDTLPVFTLDQMNALDTLGIQYNGQAHNGIAVLTTPDNPVQNDGTTVITGPNGSGGITFEISWDPSVASAPAIYKTDVEEAFQFYADEFSNDVTLYFDVGFGEFGDNPLGRGALGENEPKAVLASYSGLAAALDDNAESAAQKMADATLPSGSPFGGATLSVTDAEAAILGLGGGGTSFADPDGTIGYSDGSGFDFGDDPGLTPPSGEYDFLAVAEHEISEEMGRVSGLNQDGSDETTTNYDPVDLFRFSGPPVDGTDQRALTPYSNPSYFSTDNGITALGYGNNYTAGNTGDLADWAENGVTGDGDYTPDSYNDNISSGIVNPITPQDITVMNVLGWNLASATITQPLPRTDVPITFAQLSEDLALNEIAPGSADVPAGENYAVCDTPFDIESLTPTDITVGGLIGVDTIDASGAFTFSVAQALAAESAGISLSAPSGDDVTVADTVATLTGLTPDQVNGLKVDGVTQFIALDTAAYLEALTPDEISALQGIGVTQIAASDTPAVLSAAQMTELANAGIAVVAPPDDSTQNDGTTVIAGPNGGLTFDITWDSSVASAPAGYQSAIEAAFQFYADEFSNTTTLYFDVGYGESDGTAIGSDQVGDDEAATIETSYATLLAALEGDAQSAVQQEAYANLPATDPTGGATLSLTAAEAAALGIGGGGASSADPDGTIGYSATLDFDYATTPDPAPAAGQYDFVAAVENSIAAVLGHGSGLNDDGPDGATTSYSPLDLFRYYAPGALALSSNTNPSYFSIDGGATDLGNFDNAVEGAAGGLGNWAPTSPYTPDAYNGAMESGVVNPVTPADIAEMNVLGYQLATLPQTIPPPVAAPAKIAALFFDGTDASGNTELWVSGGAAGTTHELVGVDGIPGDMVYASDITTFGNNPEVLFNGSDLYGNDGLWISNGTAAGTYQITGINNAYPTALGGINPSQLTYVTTNFGSYLWFEGQDASGQYGLWETNGTAAGTDEIVPGLSGISGMTAFQDGVVFDGSDGGLWVSLGSPGLTTEIGGAPGSLLGYYEDSAVYAASSGNGFSPTGGLQPYGFTVLNDTQQVGGSVGGVVVFGGADTLGSGWSLGLFTFNGSQILPIQPYLGPIGTSPEAGGDFSFTEGPLTTFTLDSSDAVPNDDQIYPDDAAAFQSGNSDLPGGALWEYDGETDTVALVYGTIPAEGSPYPDPIDITPVDGVLVFSGVTDGDQTTLWLSLGSPLGGSGAFTQSLASDISGAASTGLGLDPSNLVAYDGNVYFNGTDANGQQGLWELASDDGTYVGTGFNAPDIFAVASGFELTGIANASPDGIDPQDMVGVYIPGAGTDITVGQLLEDLLDPAESAGEYVVVDSAATIESLTPAEITAGEAIGLEAIDATDTTVVLTVAQALALEDPVVIESGATIIDTAADIEAMTAAQMLTLGTIGVDAITVTDASVTLTLAQYDALLIENIELNVPSNDSVNVIDTTDSLTAAQIEALNGQQVEEFQAIGYTTLAASDTSVAMNAGVAEELVQAGIAVTVPAGDTVTISDYAYSIEEYLDPYTISYLPSIGVSAITAFDASVVLSIAQADALEAASLAITVPSGDSVSVSDTPADIESLTPTQIAALSAAGITALNATEPFVRLSVAQVLALESASIDVTAPNPYQVQNYVVTLNDTAANIELLTPDQIAGLPAVGITAIEPTDVRFNLTVAQAEAMQSASLVGGIAAIVDTAANIETLLAALVTDQQTGQISLLITLNVPALIATDASVVLTVAEAQALTQTFEDFQISVPTGDTVTIADTAANLESYLASAASQDEIESLPGYSIQGLAATDASVTLTVAEALQLEAAALPVSAPAGDTVDLADTAANIEAMTAAQLGDLTSIGVTAITVTDQSLTLTVAQALALYDPVAITVPPGDSVIVTDTASAIDALTPSEISGLAALGVTQIQVSNLASGEPLTINGGVTLSIAGAVPSGESIAFVGTGGTLSLNDTPGMAGTIYGFSPPDAIDLTDITYDPASTAQLGPTDDQLQVIVNGNTYGLQLDPSQIFLTATTFHTGEDAGGDTEITVTEAPFSNGYTQVAAGHTVDGLVIQADGTVEVQGGGAANRAVIGNGGYLLADPGATITDAFIDSGGTLELGLGTNASGDITFGPTSGDPIGGTLDIDDSNTLPAAAIANLALGDVINLTAIGYDPMGSVTIETGNTLQIIEAGNTHDLQLDPTQDFLNQSFALSTDGNVGTDITEVQAAVTTSAVIPGLTYADGAVVTNGGSVDIEPAGILIGGTVGVGGSIEVETGGTISDAVIDNTGLLDLQNGANATGMIGFGAAGGTLEFDSSNLPTMPITGMAVGDTIDLGGGYVPYDPTGSAAVLSGNQLQVIENGATYDLQLDPAQNFNGDRFQLATDNNNGTFITEEAIPCFLPGTRILTTRGEIAVEDMAVGDTVITFSGRRRPVCWVGHGSGLATRGRRSATTPVIVRKGALADSVPNADLRVTKGHSLFIDDVLIPVEFLVNHRSIRWDDRAQEVMVYHLELDKHDILIANGAAAESYRDDGNRWLFRNANAGWDQLPKPPCAPVLTGGAIVDQAWRRLLDRSGPRPGLPLTDDPDLHLAVDGRRVNPMPGDGAIYRFRLPPEGQLKDVRIVSHAAAPDELGLTRDPRVLGIALRSVAVLAGSRHRVIEAADDRLGQGFHGYEQELDIRWTDGDALLPAGLFDGLDGPQELILQVEGTAHYVATAKCREIAA